MNHKKYIVTSLIGSLFLLISYPIGLFSIVIMIFPFIWFFIYRMIDKVKWTDKKKKIC
ncbi:MAG TPA: hypothetical protein IAA29_12275 [Candidatus Paenibacillus intestinavium]|nr:hypothetical protein [Candidatus Paenibacillus intestinavium]